MEYISSDTNVWFDFYAISEVHLPFWLDCTYIMFYEALRVEVLDPPELIDELRKLGLVEIELSTEEFYLAAELKSKYSKISGYDAIALSVAKSRDILLLTGDNALRKAARKEGVVFMGSIGLLDRLLREGKVERSEYLDCLKKWKSQSANGRRLPINELDRRINLMVEEDSEV